jgi:protein involved in polysaccharide export with SLBB domain
LNLFSKFAMQRHRRLVVVLAGIAVFLVWTAGSAWAQEPQKPSCDQVVNPGEECEQQKPHGQAGTGLPGSEQPGAEQPGMEQTGPEGETPATAPEQPPTASGAPPSEPREAPAKPEAPATKTRPAPAPGARPAAPTTPATAAPAEPKINNPYEQVPALDSLYRQLPSERRAELPRFGASLFVRGATKTNEVPIDLPVGPDYVLGPGDSLRLHLWGGIARDLKLTVDREGRIPLPEAEALVVAGRTLADAQEDIRQTLLPMFNNIHVDLSVARLRTVRVYVVGDVEKAGAYDISSLSTPLNALYAAGGPTASGSLRMMRHYRGSDLVAEVDLYDLLLHGVHSHLERLQSGDTVLVPPVGPQVSVYGMVKRPAIYEIKGETDLAAVLDLAGGIQVTATLHQVKVERVQAHERRVLLSLQVEAANEESARKALASFSIQDGDRVTVEAIRPATEQVVFLTGHVVRPGRYSYHDGMQVSDLIASYKDTLPEPATRAEVVRLLPPDNHPRVIPFDLTEALSRREPVKLEPNDTVRVYGRYQVDAPKVFVYGEINKPGEYPLGQGMTISALVEMAGGLKRSAYRREADLSSYTVENGERVLTSHVQIALDHALSGDPADDKQLAPGDVLGIRQISGWKDISATVSVGGEVTYPGTYGISSGERLSSVLRRAGGFSHSAYPMGTRVERVEIRLLAENAQKQLVRKMESGLARTKKGETETEAAQAVEQRQELLNDLKNAVPSGRLVVHITDKTTVWANTPNDIELRDGDTIFIPKRPGWVMVYGEVSNAAALTYVPGMTAAWYLKQAGGTTEAADAKRTFIIRANGAVVGRQKSKFSGNSSSIRLQPGDTVIVPVRPIGGTDYWKRLIDSATLLSSLAIAARVATSF